MANIEEKVENLIKEKIESVGYELYDVLYLKEGKNYILRIVIDNENGISLEDCEKVNNEITDLLDEADYIKEQYFLEVSSPGIERLLRKDWQLKKNIDNKVQISLFKKDENGFKEYIGILKQVEDAKKSSKPKKNIINIKNKKSRSQNKKPITQESIRKELLSKIQKLYELCIKNIEVQNKNNDINSDIKSDKNKINKDVIYMLAVIELFVVKLKSKLNVNDKSNILRYELIRKIRNEIDHKHKIEKGQLLRLKEKEKFKNLQEEIEEKTNKILFLRKRKIIPVYNWNNMNKEKRIKFINKVNFEDFMFD